jgi:hypothetical protein
MHTGFGVEFRIEVMVVSHVGEELVPGQKLPVVYLLHGNGGSYQNWSNYSDVGHYAAQGLILVMVEGGSSYYVNSATRPEDKYADAVSHVAVEGGAEKGHILHGDAGELTGVVRQGRRRGMAAGERQGRDRKPQRD